jgi:predicted N-acetyltransferase YhbS
MQVEIKREKPEDREEVDLLFKLVFEPQGVSQTILNLRDSDIYIPELSRVARINDSIIGIIMYTKGEIVRGRRHVPLILLASIAVLPSYQGLGVGAQLISNSFDKARRMDYHSVLAFGQDEYFSRFGFSPAINFGITTSLEISEEEFLAMELEENSLQEAHGHLKNHSIYNELIPYHL